MVFHPHSSVLKKVLNCISYFKETNQKSPIEIVSISKLMSSTSSGLPLLNDWPHILYYLLFPKEKNINFASIDIFQCVMLSSSTLAFLSIDSASPAQLFNTHTAKPCARSQRYSFISLSRVVAVVVVLTFNIWCDEMAL